MIDLLQATLAAQCYCDRRELMHVACQLAPAGVACEFGVHTGWSLRTIRDHRKPPVYGFDSFEGLPQTWTFGDRQHEAGHFACAPPADLPTGVHLVPGWFADTLPRWLVDHLEPIRLLHIDSDLYESARTVLRLVNDRLLPGSVMVFDQVVEFGAGGYDNWRDGEWRALTEWIEQFGRCVEPVGRTAAQQAAYVVRT
jgi:hypothetical protein